MSDFPGDLPRRNRRQEAWDRLSRQQDNRKSQVEFYSRPDWLRLRYRVLLRHRGGCQCCGARGCPENPLQVDHIKPRSRYPQLELDETNMQVLCKACNLGKGAWDETDWRSI